MVGGRRGQHGRCRVQRIRRAVRSSIGLNIARQCRLGDRAFACRRDSAYTGRPIACTGRQFSTGLGVAGAVRPGSNALATDCLAKAREEQAVIGRQLPATKKSSKSTMVALIATTLDNSRDKTKSAGLSLLVQGRQPVTPAGGSGMRCPRAKGSSPLHSGGIGHHVRRHYDRRARCSLKPGLAPAGDPRHHGASAAKPGPTPHLGMRESQGQNRRGTPTGERALQGARLPQGKQVDPRLSAFCFLLIAGSRFKDLHPVLRRLRS